jgi:outer membrane protein assembly factor BamB
LIVQADPNQVKNDHVNVAKVTVSTSGGDFSDTETLYVGFWVGSANPPTPVIVQQSETTIAANPVTPVVYVSKGGSAVDEYNVYSGKLIETLTTIAAKIGAMEVSSNGQILFVFDTRNQDVVALNAKNGQQIASYPVGQSLGQNMVYARPLGQPALYLSGGPIISVPKGEVLATGLDPGRIAVTPDGQHLYGVDVGVDPATLSSYSVGLSGKVLAITSLKSRFTSGENCQDLAVSHDGAHVYPACGAPYAFEVYDGQTLKRVQKLRAVPYPDNIEIDENDNAVGGLAFSYQKFDVYVYDQAGNTIAKVAADQSAMQSGDMKVSGDGTRVMVLTSSTLNIRTIP